MFQDTIDENLKGEGGINYPIVDPNEVEMSNISNTRPNQPQLPEERISASTNDGRVIEINITSDQLSQNVNPINSVTVNDTISGTNNTVEVDEKIKRHKKVIYISLLSICLICTCGFCCFVVGLSVISGQASAISHGHNHHPSSGCGGSSSVFTFCVNYTKVMESPNYSTKKFSFFTDDVSYYTCGSLLTTLSSPKYSLQAFTMSKGDECYFIDSYYRMGEIEELKDDFRVSTQYCSESCGEASYSYPPCGDSSGQFHSFFEMRYYECAYKVSDMDD